MSHWDKSVPFITAPFAANGTVTGSIQLANTFGFYTGQKCNVSASGLNTVEVEVLENLNATTLRVAIINPPNVFGSNGPTFPATPNRTSAGSDMSAYTTALGAAISAPITEKQRMNLDAGQIPIYTYMPDPIAAVRTYEVDNMGNFAGIAANPAAFQASFIGNSTLTNTNTSIGGAFNAMTLSRNVKIASFTNGLNAGVGVALNGVADFSIPAGSSLVFDVGSNGLYWASGTTIGLFYNTGVTATSGTFGLSFQG